MALFLITGVGISSHGYKSYWDIEEYFQIVYQFPLAGIAVFRFDQGGALNGESEGELKSTTLPNRINHVF